MKAVPLKPKFSVKYLKRVSLDEAIKNHPHFDKKLVEEEWHKVNPKAEPKK